jgi:hypothetical protein
MSRARRRHGPAGRFFVRGESTSWSARQRRHRSAAISTVTCDDLLMLAPGSASLMARVEPSRTHARRISGLDEIALTQLDRSAGLRDELRRAIAGPVTSMVMEASVRSCRNRSAAEPSRSLRTTARLRGGESRGDHEQLFAPATISS